MAPPPVIDPTSLRFRARAIRRESRAIRSESLAIRQKLHEQYDRSRYLKAVTREVLHMVSVKQARRGD